MIMRMSEDDADVVEKNVVPRLLAVARGSEENCFFGGPVQADCQGEQDLGLQGGF